MSLHDWTVLALGIAGVLIVAIGALHIWMPQLMGWGAELGALSPMSRLVIHVHSAFIGLTCAGIGASALLLGGELASGSPLALAIDGFAALFFAVRWVLELGPIGRLAEGWWRWLHVLGVVGWLAFAAVFAAAGVVGLTA